MWVARPNNLLKFKDVSFIFKINWQMRLSIENYAVFGTSGIVTHYYYYYYYYYYTFLIRRLLIEMSATGQNYEIF